MSTETEYLKALNNIELKLNSDNAIKLNEILDELYNIKPVRLKWFILKAKALKLLDEDFNDLKGTLLKKYDLLYNNKSLVDVLNCLVDLTDDNTLKQRYLYHIDLFKGNDDNEGLVKRKTNEYNYLIGKFLNDSISQEQLEKLILNCYIRMDFEQCVLYNAVYEKIYGNAITIDERATKLPNIEMTIERLREHNNKTYIVIEDERNNFNCKAIIKALQLLGNNIFLIDKPVDVEMDNKIKIKEMISVSLSNAIQQERHIIISPIRLIYSDGSIKNNIEYLVDYIDKKLAIDNLSYIYCSGYITDVYEVQKH